MKSIFKKIWNVILAKKVSKKPKWEYLREKVGRWRNLDEIEKDFTLHENFELTYLYERQEKGWELIDKLLVLKKEDHVGIEYLFRRGPEKPNWEYLREKLPRHRYSEEVPEDSTIHENYEVKYLLEKQEDGWEIVTKIIVDRKEDILDYEYLFRRSRKNKI